MSSEEDEANAQPAEPSEDALYAVDELYEKAAILGERTGLTAQQVIIDFSMYNGYSLDSRERCLQKEKWVYMTDKKIGEEIDRLDRPTDAEFQDYAPWIFGIDPDSDAALSDPER